MWLARARVASYRGGMRSTIVLVLAALLTAACGDPLDEEWEELERAEAHWERADIEDYAFTLLYGCFCELAGEFAIVVHGDSITSAKRVDDSGPLSDTVPAMTVPEMFARIRTGLEREPDRVTLRYHELGFPQTAEFDFEENAADEEWSFGVDEFHDLTTD
jgi:hypothetical protein